MRIKFEKQKGILRRTESSLILVFPFITFRGFVVSERDVRPEPSVTTRSHRAQPLDETFPPTAVIENNLKLVSKPDTVPARPVHVLLLLASE